LQESDRIVPGCDILDTSFGAGGTVVVNYSSGTDYFATPQFQSDGKIVVGVLAYTGSTGGAFTAARFNDDGSPDTGFGATSPGRTSIPMPEGGYGAAVTLDASGRILITGIDAYDIPARDFTIVRLLSDGTLDTTFGTGGIVNVDFTGAQDSSHVTLVQPDGKLLVVGQVAVAGIYQIAVARFDPDGALETSFGTGGLLAIPVDDFSQPVTSHLLPDGDLLISGSSFPVGYVRNFLLRVLPCGPCDLLTSAGCIAPPPAGCKPAGRAKLVLRNKADDVHDLLSFQHRKGPASTLGEFGEPANGDVLRFCLVTPTPGGEVPRLRAHLGPLDAPTWSASGTGRRMKDPTGLHDGIVMATFKPGAAGRPALKLRGDGVRLRMPMMPLGSMPLRARLQAATGACWEADFAPPTTDSGEVYKAKVP
jgi:uncharacterized delta-60 repeat protein